MPALFIPIICSIIILLNSLPLAARETSDDFLGIVRQWSEWGEYARIIDAVPRYLDTSSCIIDSLSLAELHKYLGVAQYAAGNIDTARAEFILAHGLHESVTLDKRYVSDEMYAFFISAIDSRRRMLSENAARDSLALLQKMHVEKLSAGKSLSRRRAHAFAAAFFLCLTGGCAAAASYQYAATESLYDEFSRSASNGDLRTYEQRKDDVARGDRLTVGACGAAGICAIASTSFFVRWVYLFRAGRNTSSAVGGPHINSRK